MKSDVQLTLPIKGRWFQMILGGEKLEEYREIKPYYDVRFKRLFGWCYDELLPGETVAEEMEKDSKVWIRFRNGYSGSSPYIDVLCSLSVGLGKSEWGAEKGKIYYRLRIHELRRME